MDVRLAFYQLGDDNYMLGLHTALMQRYGGAPGIRDPGALEAALFRPQTGYHEDIFMEAAALIGQAVAGIMAQAYFNSERLYHDFGECDSHANALLNRPCATPLEHPPAHSLYSARPHLISAGHPAKADR